MPLVAAGAAGVPPNAAGETAATVLVGARAPDAEAGMASTAGAVPAIAFTVAVGMAGAPIVEASGVRFDSAAEGVPGTVGVAVTALPDGGDDTAAGDTGARGVGCDAVTPKAVPVDASVVAAATVGAIAEGSAAVTLDAPVAGVETGVAAAVGGATYWKEVSADVVRAGVAGASADVIDAAPVAPVGDDAAAGARSVELYTVPVIPVAADGATEAADIVDAAGCDGEPEAVFVMPANEGVAATGVWFDACAVADAAEPVMLPTGDDAPVAEDVGAAANGSADNGLDHDADAGVSTEAGSAIAAVDVSRADAGGAARCVSAGQRVASPAGFTAAFQTAPVTASAGVGFAAARVAVAAAAAAGIASASGRVGVAAIDEAGRGAVGAACSTGFRPSSATCAFCFASADTMASDESAGCDGYWPTMPAAGAASCVSTVRPRPLAAAVTAIDSPASASGAATGAPCDTSNPETG